MNTKDFISDLNGLATDQATTKPHKLLATLAVLVGLKQGKLRDNRVFFDTTFRQLFSALFAKYAAPADRDRPLAPFFHLRTTRFWKLAPQPGMEGDLSQTETVGGPGALARIVSYAYLEEELYKDLTEGKQLDYAIGAVESILQRWVTDRNTLPANTPEATSASTADASRFPHEAQSLRSICTLLQSARLGSSVPTLEVYDKATNDYYECDLIVICAFGIFVTELKHWSGRIEVGPRTWRINGSQYRPDPHASNRFKCKILRGIYRHAFPTLPDLWCESVVVLTNAEADVLNASPANTDLHNPTLAGIDRFIDFLRHRQSQYAGHALTADQIRAVTAKFESLRVLDRVKGYNFPGYEVVDRLTQREDLVELIVRPTSARRRTLQRFRVFSPPLKASPADRECFLRKANNTLDALSKAGEHPNLLRVWSVPHDSGQVIEASEWSEEGTLADLIDRNPNGMPWDQALHLVTGILGGLAAVHQQAVIHRMLKPENVLICGAIPRLMNFDLAYQLEENHVTVIPDASAIKPNPYTAPEVFLKHEPSEATDLFSVGVILFELLTGRPPFSASADLATAGGQLPPGQLDLLAPPVPDLARQIIHTLVQTDPQRRFQRAEQVLELLAPPKPAAPAPPPPNRQLSPGETHDLFEIEALHAQGGHAQIYRAIRGSQQERVALKVFNADVSQDRARAELSAAQAINSPYAVRVESLGHWKNERFFLVQNLIEGPSLRTEIREGKRPTPERFVEVAQDLLQALAQLHGRQANGQPAPLLHNDIKPDNILLRAPNHPVLIDFGVASPPGVATYVGTEGYVAPDLRNGADLEFCPSGDLFALGTTLFEWFYGLRPYESPVVGAACRDVAGLRPDSVPAPIHVWLVHAVATSKTQRFTDARDMLGALTQAWVEARTPVTPPAPPVPPTPPQAAIPQVTFGIEPVPGNPFLAYLNSLQNTTGSNENSLAETQALSPFFGLIHVPSSVAHYARKQLTGKDRRHVILTGHAGDGKSTIGLELFKSLKGLPMDKPLSKPLQPVEEIHVPGQPRITLVKDMSELPAPDRLRILSRACSANSERFFIISNTGTLLATFKELFKDQPTQWPDLENTLLNALSTKPPSQFSLSSGAFDVVNLVQVDNLNATLDIFQRMVDEEPWQPCANQPCRNACPVFRNVTLLRNNWATLRERVGLAYRRLFEYGDRLTLRQTTAHLAYAITSGLSCQDVSGQSLHPISRPITDFLFFNRFWGEGATGFDDRALQLKAIRVFRTIGAGRQLVPSLERKLWMRGEDEPLPAVPDDLKTVFTSLRQLGRKLAEAEGLHPSQGRAQLRRLLFFFGALQAPETAREYIAAFLGSRMLPEYAVWQKPGAQLSNIDRDRLLRNVLHVLQEHFAGLHLPEEVSSLDDNLYITLNRHGHDVRQSAQVVLARLNRSDFKLALDEKAWPGVSRRADLLLTEARSGALLKLELPFLDFVMQRHTGDIASSIQAGYLDRLERFKAQLLNAYNASAEQDMMLVRLQTNHRFATQKFALNNGVLEVL